MSTPLDYASPTGRLRGVRLRTIVRLFWILLGIAAVGFMVVTLVVWLVFHQMDKVTLTIDNQTGKTLDSARVTDGDGKPILTLGPILPGSRASATIHFGNDEGGESDVIISQGGRSSRQGVWMLFDTHGPYEYTATVRSTGVHLEWSVASKGSGTDDFASPTTIP